MKAMTILLTGTAVCACGGLLLFPRLDILPLWLVWTIGPMCWYLGSSAMLVGGSVSTYQFLTARQVRRAGVSEPETIRVMEFKRLMPFNLAPMGVTREIPPMGGCVI